MFLRKNYIGIDFSTINTQIYAKRYGIVYNEPALLCYDANYKNIYAGYEAQDKANNNPELALINPLLETTIDVFLIYFKLILNKIHKLKLHKRLTLLLSFTIDPTQDEIKMIENVCKLYNVRNVMFVDPIILTAVGNGINISSDEPKMMIYIGATISNLVVFAKDKIKIKEELTYSGNYFDDKIIQYVQYKYDILIDSFEAQAIKVKLADLLPEHNNKVIISNSSYYITSEEIRPLLLDGIDKLVINIKKVLEVLSIPTLKSINEHGVILAGGFANIYGIEAYFKEKLRLNIVISKNPTLGIIDGMNIVLKNIENHILTKNSII